MKVTRKLVVILFLCATGARPDSPLTFCDLLRDPEKFNGKEITVRATYRYGFEWQQLYCLDCLDKGKAWMDASRDLDHASIKSLKRVPKDAGIVNLTVQGVFIAGDSYGHLNGYRYQIVARKITDVVVIQKGMKSVAKAKEAEERWACGGTNPK